ncbi:MAG: tetratricopeptide repeat protein [Bacteroidetes bacterium]|nr:tetratricopeptide repeat protein [Bacteroidota bacterium]
MKRTAFIMTILAFLFTGCLRLYAVSVTDPMLLMQRGNTFYNEGNYDSAMAAYDQVIRDGYASADLYYNLGNTYFKLKKIPKAILYYEKAYKLDPSDEDIRHNLALANTMIVDRIETLPDLFYKVWWNAFYGMLSADAWAWVSVVMMMLTLIMALLYFTASSVLLRKTGFFSGLVFLLGMVVTMALASQKYYYTRQVNEAIVFMPTINAKSSPTVNSVDLFVLHEGTKVYLIDAVGSWHKIRIANGSVGWLPSEAIEGI